MPLRQNGDGPTRPPIDETRKLTELLHNTCKFERVRISRRPTREIFFVASSDCSSVPARPLKKRASREDQSRLDEHPNLT